MAMVRKTPEGKIKSEICAYLALLKRQGKLDFWLSHSTGLYDPTAKKYRMRNSPYDRKGIPDISGILAGGRAFFVEVKSPKGKLTKEQRDFLNSAHQMGALCILARKPADVFILAARVSDSV